MVEFYCFSYFFKGNEHSDMDPKLTEVSQLFQRFKAAFVRNNFDTCATLLSQLKVFFFLNSLELLNFPLILFLVCVVFYYKSRFCLCFGV